jgi:hypothetical protein
LGCNKGFGLAPDPGPPLPLKVILPIDDQVEPLTPLDVRWEETRMREP